MGADKDNTHASEHSSPAASEKHTAYLTLAWQPWLAGHILAHCHSGFCIANVGQVLFRSRVAVLLKTV
jgi:hypothetical protein